MGRIDFKHPCENRTKKGKPCPIEADRYRGDRWVCHIHDPEGQYRLNVPGLRELRLERKALGRRDERSSFG